MSGSGRKRVSKWDSKEEDTEHLSGNDNVGKSSSSYFREKDPEHARFYPEGNGTNGSRGDDDDDDSRQHPGEAWPPRNRGDAAMMSYYDTKNSSEQDESMQPLRDRLRTRSGSRSNSRSRSRSPLQRVRRDVGGGSSGRHMTRARVSPRRSGREADGRYNRAGDYDWEVKNRKTRDTSYYKEESREQYPVRVGGRSDYSSDFPEGNNNSRRETQRRDVPEREYNRISNVPCRYFALGNCRNGTSCRFSHHVAPERKLQEEMFNRHDNSNYSDTTERMRNSHIWNNIEKSDKGKSSEVETSRVSDKVMSGGKGNNGNWIDDMEMSPDWNYGVKTLKKPRNKEQAVLKDTLAPAYEHGSAAISQQDGDLRSIAMFPTVGEKTVASPHHGLSNISAPPIQTFNQDHSPTDIASSHQSFSNNNANTAPLVKAFSQIIENHGAVPYQNTPLPVGGSQMLPPAATHLPGGLNPENGNAQNTVSREELNHISNISASLAHLFGNGQPIMNLRSTLNPKQAMQVPEIYGKKEQTSHTQSELLSNNSIHTGVVPAVTALQINNSDNLVLAGNREASSEENRDKRTDEEASNKPDGRKTEESNAEKVVEEEDDDDDDGAGDENKKKEKDPKGMRAFKFALVEIIKELLKPAWKEGGMNKDAYKSIVKKVVDKVTGAIQTGNIPQTQEKIDHYLSASKPKLTKLVQAYISKVKKS